MPTVNKTTDLGYLGEEFQIKLVKCLIEDGRFFASIQHIVDQNMFSGEHLRRIVGFMKDRYAENEVIPTYFDIETMARSQISDVITIDLVLATIQKIKDMNLSGMDLVENETEKFFKQQNLIKAVNRIQDIIKDGNASRYYEIEDLIVQALQTNTCNDNTFNPLDCIDKALSDDYRQTISTGTKELDDSLGGGLGLGELGLIIAPSNVGKSSICTGFAAEAAINRSEINQYKGFKVLHYFFEDRDLNISRKYYGHVLDIDAMTLSYPDVRPYAVAKLKEDNDINRMIKENIRCEQLSSGEVSASDIKERIKRQISMGFKPDLVIIDYFECLRLEKTEYRNDTEWSREAVTMRKLESICKELNVAMWVPVQGTKGSLGAEFVGLQHAGGAVQKIQIGHIVITLARTEQQKKQGKLNLYIQKLRAIRFTRDKFVGAKFNNGTCRFDMSEAGETLDDEIPDHGLENMHMAVARDVKMKNSN